jgi:dihydroxyacid dehydratase/phosphogluconate dehydratase
VSGCGLRSARWFGGADLAGFIHRASLHAEGISRGALAGRPVVGICNSWCELVNCNLHFRSHFSLEEPDTHLDDARATPMNEWDGQANRRTRSPVWRQ